MAAVGVKWTINPQVGSIDNSGLYTAPDKINPNEQSVMITATLRNNSAMSVTTGIALYPPVAISVSPGPTLTLQAGRSQQFLQSINNALDNGVDWSISPRTLGTISANGLYTPPATLTKQQNVVVTATSIADQSKAASTTVTLQP
jgi:hypothetical protein